MKLLNTLTRQVEDFQPIKEGQVSIYSCGPTVYNHATIGNLSAFIYADTLQRGLAGEGYSIKHTINITDVDDKTISGSKEQYPDMDRMEALVKLTNIYTDIFFKDMALVGNNIDAYRFTKATDYIEQMQSVIKRLYEKGFAYVADDGVYFSIDAYKNSGKTYGQLSQITTSSTSEARIQNDEYDKLSAHDFALWKIQKDDDPVWDFELNGKSLKGRPGWHIECSAMSESSLGIPFDIHTGGVDLIFPHHENEIAQSTAGQDEPKLASYFVHSEHMLVDGQKMSKSLNNFLTLKDIQDKNYDPLVLRLLVLQSHYNNQAHFSWDNLDAAKSRLQDLRNMAVLRWQPRKLTHDASTFALEDVAKQIQTCVSNNLDTPGALALLSNVSTQLQVVHIEEDMVDHFEFMLLKIDELLGLDLMSLKDINEEQKALIKARQNAREDKDWATADKIRDQLLADNIAVRDETHGPIWSYLG